MNTSQLIAFLNAIEARPRKDLSQNFLINPTAIAQIVDLAQIVPNDWVLEIGPGAGAITEELLARGAHVLAVEKDPLFAKHLHRMQTEDHRLEIVCADFLTFPIPSGPSHKFLPLGLRQSPGIEIDREGGSIEAIPPPLSTQSRELSREPQCKEFTRKTTRKQTWKVVSNLPFQITAPILTILSEQAQQFESATLVVQKEVGDRISANPHSKLMGALTIFLQFYTELTGSFPLSSSSFYPKPAVESTVVRLHFKHAKPPIDPNLFFPIIHQAFQQRRKMVTTSLKKLYPKLAETLQKLGIPIKVRPEDLSLQEWIKIITDVVSRS